MNINLPKKIPIFPLSNVIFFPKTILPLNIFEKRYIQLVNDCIKSNRLFGMIQPKEKGNPKPKIYNVGCLGKIVNFSETNDKRYIINLSGVCRFKIKEELATEKLYREFNVDYSDFETDLNRDSIKKNEYDVNDILKKLKILFKKRNYLIDWPQLEELKFEELVNTICMISPFSLIEKQKLIEAIKMENKLKALDEIINFNLLDSLENNTVQ
tara:strand:+ start:3357 stop:3992 length:636 start_codon:yes stop_codon:yes gene_type:complete